MERLRLLLCPADQLLETIDTRVHFAGDDVRRAATIEDDVDETACWADYRELTDRRQVGCAIRNEFLHDACLGSVVDVGASRGKRSDRQVGAEGGRESDKNGDARLSVTREQLGEVPRVDSRCEGDAPPRDTGVATQALEVDHRAGQSRLCTPTDRGSWVGSVRSHEEHSTQRRSPFTHLP